MSQARATLKALVLLAALVLAPFLAAEEAPVPSASEGFHSEGSLFISTASGKGSSAQDAQARARSAALHGLFVGLGKDGLFSEVFASSPPIGLDFELLDSSRDGLAFKALVQLRVDDESIRIVERGPYLAAAMGILDKAESASDEADAHRASATAAETSGDLGTALGQYGMAVDGCRSALQLINPVEDPSVFSSKGKRTAPELKKGLAATLADSSAGVERVKKAEAELAADASSAAASDVADAALAAVEEAQALLDEAQPILGDLSAYGDERLAPLRDRLAIQRRRLSDSGAALKRAQASLEKGRGGYAGDKIDFASRRLLTADESLARAFRSVDREIRDPSVRRAERARAIRWAFLHAPREYLSLRSYLPFKLAAGEGGTSSSPLDASLGLEGAFPMGSGGVWVRSRASLVSTDLEPALSGGDELAFGQFFDLGFWGRSLFFAGYSWDWLRQVDGLSFPKKGAIRLGLGGVYQHQASEESFHRADWLLALSYELPYQVREFRLWESVNAGLDAEFRLGSIALLEASISKRLDQRTETEYASLLRWSIGLGLRLPPPFTFGAEYFGAYVQPLLPGGDLGDASGFDGGRFRFFVGYSI